MNDLPASWPLGAPEIGKFLNVGPRTVHAWRHRGVMPDPDYPAVNGHPAWRSDTVRSWAIATGRLDPTTGEPQSRACHPEIRARKKK